jgi:hypothetical protein
MNLKISQLPLITAEELQDDDLLVIGSASQTRAIRVRELKKATSIWRYWIKIKRMISNDKSIRNSWIC